MSGFVAGTVYMTELLLSVHFSTFVSTFSDVFSMTLLHYYPLNQLLQAQSQGTPFRPSVVRARTAYRDKQNYRPRVNVAPNPECSKDGAYFSEWGGFTARSCRFHPTWQSLDCRIWGFKSHAREPKGLGAMQRSMAQRRGGTICLDTMRLGGA
jgi:hypothetical protein